MRVEIPFQARWGEIPLRCNPPPENEDTHHSLAWPIGDTHHLQLSDLRFYVSEIQLVDEQNQLHTLELIPDKRWQNDAVALVDLENGREHCSNGSPNLNDRVIGHVAERNYTGLRFTVGVPIQLNHADPLLAAAPLGDSAMHWHWRSGYKFLRAGVRSREHSFWVHLGSTGCEGTIGNIHSCRAPNRVTVGVPEFRPGLDAVVVDLQALLAGTALADGASGDCSSGPAESACLPVFEALGLGAEAVSVQTVFRRGQL